MSKKSPDTDALLEAMFLGVRDAQPTDVVDAAAAISASKKLEQKFDALAMADRGLSGDLDTPGSFERDFGRSLFEGKLDAMLNEESGDSQGNTPDAVELPDNVVPLRVQPRRPFAAYASAAAVLVLGAISMMNNQTVSPENVINEFQARTASVAGLEPIPGTPKVVTFCVERSAGEVEFTGPDESAFGVVSCPNDAEIKLAVENSNTQWKWAAFFGVHENGTLLWYGPTPASEQPIAIGSTSEVEPVGETIRLSVNHTPGAVRVHALFTNEPVDFGMLDRWVGSNRLALFDHAMIVEPDVGSTHTQLFEVKP